MHRGGYATVRGRALSGLVEDYSHSMTTYHKGKIIRIETRRPTRPYSLPSRLCIVLSQFGSLSETGRRMDLCLADGCSAGAPGGAHYGVAWCSSLQRRGVACYRGTELRLEQRGTTRVSHESRSHGTENISSQVSHSSSSKLHTISLLSNRTAN